MEISLLDFIKTGKFGTVEVGQLMDNIKSCFPEPDTIWDAQNGMSIWSYGSLEFHFTDETLFLIWCDWLEHINQSDKFSLDLWVLDDLDKLKFPYFCSILNGLQIDYTIRESRYSDMKLPDNVILNIVDSGIDIYFEDKHDTAVAVDDYHLIAIGKSLH